MNEQQLAAVEATGEVFVSAGAGTGKTAVLVERFTRAVVDRGLDVDSILVITYTRRAAGELRTRIRHALGERDRPDLARELDGAWISTIHGFCLRLLKAYPFAAGLDPRFRELDENQGAVIRSEAFAQALAEFCADGDDDRLRLLATYGAGGLRRMLTGVYATLRSAGRDLRLDIGGRPELAERIEELREAARTLAADVSATDLQRGNAQELLALLDRDARPDRLMELSGFRASGERAASYEDARRLVEQAALDEAAARDRDLLQELLTRFAAAYAEAKARESALDFEDLQLAARDLLRDHAEIRERESLRFRSIMVDEFQDTNQLQCELVDLLRGPAAELFFVGDEFQSIYGFRHADVGVFRERRAQAEQLLPLTQNYRSRPEVLAAVNELFGAHFGDEFQQLHAAAEFPDPVFGHPVELLVTDKASYKDTGIHWRRAEARAVARRVRELVDAGVASAGRGRAAVRGGHGRGVVRGRAAQGGSADVPRDRQGLLRPAAGRRSARVPAPVAQPLRRPRTVDGARVAVRRALERRAGAAPSRSVEAAAVRGARADAAARPRRAGRAAAARVPAAVRPARRRAAAAVARAALRTRRQRARLRPRGARASDGRRRYANLRKLARLARSYEELRGPDVEGFVRFVAEQEAVGARELEAVAEEEGADAVRLLTIHAAKGLEFKVVIVADAGRDKAPPSAGRDPRALGRPLRLPRCRSGDVEAPRRVRLRGRQGRAERRGGSGEAAALLRRDDAREGTPDRLRLH